MNKLADLKQNLQKDIWDTFEAGIQLPDGCTVFYDHRNECFVDGATLKPVKGSNAVLASELYQTLSATQQRANRSYLTFCTIYSDLDRGGMAGIAPIFNYATRPVRPQPEPVADIVQRVITSLFAPRP